MKYFPIILQGSCPAAQGTKELHSRKTGSLPGYPALHRRHQAAPNTVYPSRPLSLVWYRAASAFLYSVSNSRPAFGATATPILADTGQLPASVDTTRRRAATRSSAFFPPRPGQAPARKPQIRRRRCAPPRHRPGTARAGCGQTPPEPNPPRHGPTCR